MREFILQTQETAITHFSGFIYFRLTNLFHGEMALFGGEFRR